MKSIVTFTEIILFTSVQCKGHGDHRRAQNLYSGNYGPVSASLETHNTFILSRPGRTIYAFNMSLNVLMYNQLSLAQIYNITCT